MMTSRKPASRSSSIACARSNAKLSPTISRRLARWTARSWTKRMRYAVATATRTRPATSAVMSFARMLSCMRRQSTSGEAPRPTVV